MVRTPWTPSLVALVVVFCTAANVLSQDRTPRPAYTALVYWPALSELVSQEAILRDLKLTADQQESIRQAQADYQQILAANPLVRGPNFAEAIQKRGEAFPKREEALRAALGERAQRLDQISAQSAGLAALVTRPILQQQLAITEEQVTKAKEILEATYREMLAVAGTPFISSADAAGAENRKTFVDKTTPKLLELLTDEQKKRWQDATGEPLPAATLATVRTSPRGGFGTSQGSRDRGPSGGAVYGELVLWPSLSQLVSQAEILSDLQLTAEQQASVGKAQEAYRQTIVANPLGGGQTWTEVLPKQQEAARKRDEAIRAALGDKAKRLDRVAAQSAGLAALVTRTALRQQLGITDEQLAKGRTILEETYQEMLRAEAEPGRSPRLSTSGSRGAANRTAFVDKTTPKLLGLLTDEQKQRWQDAVGEAVPAETLVAVRRRTSSGFASFPDREGADARGGDRGARGESPQSSAARLYREAGALAQSKDYPAAVKKMKEAIDLAPDSDLYRAYASHVERLAGSYAEGMEHALQAIKINEKKVGWYYASAAFNAHAKGDLEVARVYCRKVVDLGAEAVGQANFDAAKRLLAELESKK